LQPWPTLLAPPTTGGRSAVAEGPRVGARGLGRHRPVVSGVEADPQKLLERHGLTVPGAHADHQPIIRGGSVGATSALVIRARKLVAVDMT
jgi:hypothetical protein